MAAKPETTFYQSVHRHLPPTSVLDRIKMSNPYVGGIFDHWYDGPKNDLWIEWKWIDLPKRDSTVIDLTTPRGKKQESPLSALQQEWGRRRYENGRSVWVGVGCREGGVLYRSPEEWIGPRTAAEFKRDLVTRQQIAQRIADHCLL